MLASLRAKVEPPAKGSLLPTEVVLPEVVVMPLSVLVCDPASKTILWLEVASLLFPTVDTTPVVSRPDDVLEGDTWAGSSPGIGRPEAVGPNPDAPTEVVIEFVRYAESGRPSAEGKISGRLGVEVGESLEAGSRL